MTVGPASAFVPVPVAAAGDAQAQSPAPPAAVTGTDIATDAFVVAPPAQVVVPALAPDDESTSGGARVVEDTVHPAQRMGHRRTMTTSLSPLVAWAWRWVLMVVAWCTSPQPGIGQATVHRGQERRWTDATDRDGDTVPQPRMQGRSAFSHTCAVWSSTSSGWRERPQPRGHWQGTR